MTTLDELLSLEPRWEPFPQLKAIVIKPTLIGSLGRCKALIRYSINEKCVGCTKCAQQCPAQAIQIRPYERHSIDTRLCVRCGTCKQVCPTDAVVVE